MKILFLVISALFVLGCSQEKKDEHKVQEKVAVETVKAETANDEQSIKEVVEAKKEAVKESAKEAVTKVQKAVSDVKKTVVEAKKKVVTEVEKVKTEVVPKKEAVIAKANVDGSKIFAKCAGCHGQHAEKKALGKSQIIKGWSVDKLTNAIHGYKNGTYGGAMKAVMKSQVSALSDAEIEAVAKHISKL